MDKVNQIVINKVPDELVTCGFTTFNSENTIEIALNSALKQDYKNIELLIVDDYSSDSTIERIHFFLKKNKIKYRLIKHHSNLGVAQARNTLLKYAKGEFLAFFDSDDFSCKNRISEQVSFIKNFEVKFLGKNKNISNSPICYSDREIYFKNNRKIYCKAIYIDKDDYKFKQEIIGSLLSCNPFPKSSDSGSTATCMLCARKKTLDFLNGFDSSLRRYEDLDLAIRAIIKDIPICRVDTPLVKQFYRATNYKKNEYRYELRLIYNHRDWLREKGLYRFAIYFSRFKKNILKLNFKNSVTYFFLLLVTNPNLFFRKIISTFNTIFFTFKISFLKFII